MSTKEKLINRFKRLPKDFTFSELVTLLNGLEFEMNNKGKTSGSRVKFINKGLGLAIDIHKPHKQGAPIKETALKDVYNYLIDTNLIK